MTARASLSAAFAVAVTLSSAAEGSQQHRIDIPRGTLGSAVIALGRQGGINIGFSDRSLAQLRVQGVRGRMTARQALSILLRDTSAEAVFVDAVTVRIQRRKVAPPAARRQKAPRPARPVAMRPQIERLEPIEIIVTGSKRGTQLQRFPGSTSIVDGDDLQLEAGSRGSDALVSRLTTLTSTHLGPGRNKLFVRGLADSSFNGPTQSTVAQYFGETRYNYNAPDPALKLYDIDRVEVLAGPQGTLYGAGALGGIIRVLPKRPNPNRFEVLASAAGSWVASGNPGAELATTLNLPVMEDRVGLRVVSYAHVQGGYIDVVQVSGSLPNPGLDEVPTPPTTSPGVRRDTNRVLVYGGRAALRLLPGDGWTIDAGLAGQRIRGSDAQYADRDSLTRTRRGDFPQPFRNDYGLADVTLTGSLSGIESVTSVGYVRQRFSERFDATEPPLSPVIPEVPQPRAFDQRNRAELVSAESRLSSNVPDGLAWVTGVSFADSRSRQERELGAPDDPIPIGGVRNDVLEAAAFGEASFPLLPRLRGTAGARVTFYRTRGGAIGLGDSAGSAVAVNSHAALLPSAALAYDASEDVLLYARYQSGFRPGGVAILSGTIERYDSDRTAMVEAGMRVRNLFGYPVDATAATAYTRWHDVQADVIDLANLPRTANLGDARIYTADVSLTARPWRGLRIEAGAVFNDSLITDPRPGIIYTPESPLPNVARLVLRLAAEYQRLLPKDRQLTVSAYARHTGKSLLGVGYLLAFEQGGWTEVALAARLADNRHAITASVSNLLGQRGNRFALGSPFLLQQQQQSTPLQPLTVRLGYDVAF